MVELPVLTLKDRNNKWLVRSAFQKAIRRGRVDEALHAGGYLFTAGVDYFWKSLATIAIEDVGCGNAEAVRDVMEVFNQGKKNPSYDSRALIGPMIEALCLGLKSRSCCELSVGSEFGSPDLFYELCNKPLKLVDYAYDLTDPVRAYAATAIILGVHKSNRKPLNGLVLDLKSRILNHPALSEIEKWYVLNSYCSPVDSMCAAAYITLMMAKSAECSLVYPVFPEETYPKGVSSAAMDMHTSDGKKALAAFHTSLSKIYPVIESIPKETAVKALGAVVFVLEGGLVNHRIDNPALASLKLLQDIELMIGYGLPKSSIPEVMEIVGKEFARLNQKREWVAGL